MLTTDFQEYMEWFQKSKEEEKTNQTSGLDSDGTNTLQRLVGFDGFMTCPVENTEDGQCITAYTRQSEDFDTIVASLQQEKSNGKKLYLYQFRYMGGLHLFSMQNPTTFEKQRFDSPRWVPPKWLIRIAVV